MKSKLKWLLIVPIIALASLLLTQVAVTANSPTIGVASVLDGDHSADSYLLANGLTGTTDDVSWKNGTNRWQSANFPMTAVLDLGETHQLSSIRFYAGQIPFPGTAKIYFDASSGGPDGPFTQIGSATGPQYDAWSPWIGVTGQARYVRVRFETQNGHFNLSEVELQGTPMNTGTGGGTHGTTTGSTGSGGTTGGPVVDAHLATSIIDSFGEAPRPNGELGPGWAAIDTYYSDYPRRSGECSKELHNSYWVVGQDNKIHPTWHPTIHPSGCSFAHEHGDDPRLSPLYDLSLIHI